MIHRLSADSELTDASIRPSRRSMGEDQRYFAGREGHVGVTAKDNRLFVEAVLYRYRAGIPWRDLPERLAIQSRFTRDFRAGPCVDGSGLARRIFTSQDRSEQPCVRPVCAVHMTAGHNALRGSGPGQKHAFEMPWPKWVVLIAGSTGTALRAVRPPNRYVTPARRDLV